MTDEELREFIENTLSQGQYIHLWKSMPWAKTGYKQPVNTVESIDRYNEFIDHYDKFSGDQKKQILTKLVTAKRLHAKAGLDSSSSDIPQSTQSADSEIHFNNLVRKEIENVNKFEELILREVDKLKSKSICFSTEVEESIASSQLPLKACKQPYLQSVLLCSTIEYLDLARALMKPLDTLSKYITSNTLDTGKLEEQTRTLISDIDQFATRFVPDFSDNNLSRNNVVRRVAALQFFTPDRDDISTPTKVIASLTALQNILIQTSGPSLKNIIFCKDDSAPFEQLQRIIESLKFNDAAKKIRTTILTKKYWLKSNLCKDILDEINRGKIWKPLKIKHLN